VLHVAPSVARSYGGPTQSLVGFALAARAAGAEVEVAAPRCDAADEAWLGERMPGVPLHLFGSAGGGGFVFSPGLGRFLRANGARFDAVHVHGLLNPVSSAAARTCIRRGWPVVIRPFGTLSRYTFQHRRGGLKRAYFRWMDGPNVRHAGGVHFTTAEERDEAGWHGIDLSTRGHVIPPPWTGARASGSASADSVSAEPAAPESSSGEVSTDGNGKGGGRNALFLSRLHPVKNLEALLDAWPSVVRALPDATLTVAGSGEDAYAAGLRGRAHALGIAPSVRWTGFVSGDEKARLLASADLFVLPSHHENFGFAVLEALAAGLPAVVSPRVQLAEFVSEHRLGLVAETDGGGAALADAVVRAMGDGALRERCRAHGADAVRAAFAPLEIGRRLAEMYRAAGAAMNSSTSHNASTGR
jgi:glycosyltransferase involved in cell wall biosynthesis